MKAYIYLLCLLFDCFVTGGEEPGNEANTTIDYIYTVECESELQ